MSATSENEAAGAAFMAGWKLSQLYYGSSEWDATARNDLPTVKELGRVDRVRLTLLELKQLVSVDLIAVIKESGYDQTITTEISSMTEGLGSADSKTSEDILSSVKELYINLLIAFTIDGRSYGTAYTLGRSLFETCNSIKSGEDLKNKFNRYRIANIQGWLSDTVDLFPNSAARVVSISLDKWVNWVSENAKLDWESQKVHVENALRIQGEHWRALLSGDKDPRSLLTTEGYVAAAELALGRASHILRRVAARFWFVLVVTLGLTAAAAYLSIVYGAGTAKVWAFAVSVATGLGATGKGLQAAAKHLVVSAGETLFSTSEEEVVSAEILWLPYLDKSWRGDRRLRREGVIKRPLGDGTK